MRLFIFSCSIFSFCLSPSLCSRVLLPVHRSFWLSLCVPVLLFARFTSLVHISTCLFYSLFIFALNCSARLFFTLLNFIFIPWHCNNIGNVFRFANIMDTFPLSLSLFFSLSSLLQKKKGNAHKQNCIQKKTQKNVIKIYRCHAFPFCCRLQPLILQHCVWCLLLLLLFISCLRCENGTKCFSCNIYQAFMCTLRLSMCLNAFNFRPFLRTKVHVQLNSGNACIFIHVLACLCMAEPFYLWKNTKTLRTTICVCAAGSLIWNVVCVCVE